MDIKVQLMFLIILIVTIENTYGKENNKTKHFTGYHKHSISGKEKAGADRSKRALDDDEIPFWPQRGRREGNLNYKNVLSGDEKAQGDGKTDSDPPFWGARGRRDSSSFENYGNELYPIIAYNRQQTEACRKCYKSLAKENRYNPSYSKDRQEKSHPPFWRDRAIKISEQGENDNDVSGPFWGNRGRRQEEDPFWGARGRREEDPFWGVRGRREGDPFWGARGRREEDPFWGARGRREEDPFWGARGRREEDPFWGARGRREEDPFWGARGRRQDEDVPFWGNRGRRHNFKTSSPENPPFLRNLGRRENPKTRREQLKEFLSEAINAVEDNIESIIRSRRGEHSSFWNNRGRESQLRHIFESQRQRQPMTFLNKNVEYTQNTPEPNTVSDNRVYAEQPHYILVSRSSRSSAEEDPFFISRGKKKFFVTHNTSQTGRNRRGALEELVKSVRNDPYYIARGKKDVQNSNAENMTSMLKEFGKAKELICATIDLILIKHDETRMKREVDDTERDRRTILKKLAAQLQMDPYYVSRGKKNESDVNDHNLEEFIHEVSSKCN